VYDIERTVLRTGALVDNFQKLEELEVLSKQLRDTSTAVRALQSKLDDQLFPWLTRTNIKKHGPTVLAFTLIAIATLIWFKSNGHSSTPTSYPSPIQSSQSAPSNTLPK
jgi:hypothetical protein